MAIYTQYGRYIKAKQFKEMLLSQGSLYMVLGFGNPKWDNMASADDDADENQPQQMPIAAYDTHILTVGDVDSNQFCDNNIQQCYISQNGLERSIQRGYPCDGSTPSGESSPLEDSYVGHLMKKYQNLVPPFPCIWHGDGTTTLINGSNITQDNYEEWYIDVNSNPLLYNATDGTSTTVNWPPGSSVAEELEKQYYSELVLRGKAIANGLIHPVGLLGAVKCTVSFVKDIGPTIDNYQPNDKPYFWYGDRYWQIVEANDEDLDRYITERIENDSNADNSQVIYPHHLVIRAMIPPHTFCNELKYDQHLIAREIALFTKKRRSSNEDLLSVYRADEYAFNFGQYYKDPSTDQWVNMPQSFVNSGNILNFTLPCTIDGRKYPGDEYDFKFILNDYIRGGGIRHSHSMDLISYIIGF